MLKAMPAAIPSAWHRAFAPALGASLLGLLVNLTGRWLAGNAATTSATDQLALQGAQTTCFYLSWMIGSFGIPAGAGVTTLVSRLVGAGDWAGANLAMHQAILIAAAVALAGLLLGAFGIDWLLGILNLDGTAAGSARQFLRAMLLLLPFQLEWLRAREQGWGGVTLRRHLHGLRTQQHRRDDEPALRELDRSPRQRTAHGSSAGQAHAPLPHSGDEGRELPPAGRQAATTTAGLTRGSNQPRHPHGLRGDRHHQAPPFSTAPRRRFQPPSTSFGRPC